MNKFLLLAKTSFKMTFSPQKMFSRANAPVSKSKATGYALLFAFLFFYFLVLSGGLFYFLSSNLSGVGLAELTIYLAVVAYTGLILIITLFGAQGYLFKAKDLQMLFAMPISHFTVLLSKFLVFYCYELIFSIVMIGPAVFFYFYFTSFTVIGVICGIIAVLIAPFIPIAIGSILSFLLGLLTRRLRKKNFFTIIFTIGFIAAYMMIMRNSQSILDYILTNGLVLQKYFEKYYFPSVLFVNSINGDVVAAFLLILFTVAAVVLVIALISRRYSDIVAILNSSGVRKKYKAQNLREESNIALSAMIKKELSFYFSSSNYVLNTGIGSLMLLVASVASLFMGSSFLEPFKGMNVPASAFVAGVAGLNLFVFSVSPTTSSVISLEGKRIWIYKSIPCDTKDILKAKTLVNLIINIPAAVIGNLLFCIALKFSIIDYIVLLAISIVFIIFCSLSGILVNLYNPKLDYENEIMVIKQSASVLIQTFMGMGICGATVAAYFLLKNVNFYLFAIGFIVLFSIISFILLKKLYTNGVKKFVEL